MRARGFSLIELMVAMSILVILMLLAMPVYTEFVANTRIRNTAESMLNGVRLAQLEAVRRNTQVQFTRTANGWEVRDATTDELLHAESIFETSEAKGPSVDTGAGTEVTFNGLGRMLPTNPPGGTVPITRIKVEPGSSAGTRTLGVSIPLGGGSAKLCDPDSKFTYSGSTDPMACPYPW